MRSLLQAIVVVGVMVIAFASWAVAQNPLGGAPAVDQHPFAGSYTGEKISLELNYDNAQEAYTGWLTFQGKKYACGGWVQNSQLSGKFVADGQSYPFSMGINGDGSATLTSAGQNYQMQRKADVPANPLAGGGGGAPINPNAPPVNAGMGGAGIAFKQSADGDLVIEHLMPGGPAEKAGLQVGLYLLAVDGKSIDKMTPDQVRGLIGGPIGSKVTLTVESENNDSHDVTITRADLSGGNAPAPGPVVPDGNHPAPVVNPPDVHPQGNGGGPGWMQPGMRLTWWSGSASIPGTTTVLVPDDNGDWKTPDGRSFKSSDNPGSGGYGYQQLTIASINNGMVVVDARNLLIHPENQETTSISSTGYVLPITNGGDYWQDPRQLAQMQNGPGGAVRIFRGPYMLGKNKYNVVRVTTRIDSGWTQSTYDAETGLMISSGSSTVGQAQIIPGPNGQSTVGGATTNISQGFFVGMRQTTLPWIGQRGTQQLAQLQAIEFGGTYLTEIPQVPSLTWGYGMRWEFTKIDPFSVTFRQSSAIDYRNGARPQPEVIDRSGSLAFFWIDPQILGKLQQGQVLDEDPITRKRLSVVGQRNGSVVLTEQGAMETSMASYDQQSGILNGIQLQSQVGLGKNTISIQRTK